VEGVETVPDIHFINKIRQLIVKYGIYPDDLGIGTPTDYAMGIRKLDDLNTDDLLDLYNAFRKERMGVGTVLDPAQYKNIDILQLAEEYNRAADPAEATKHPLLQLFRQIEARPYGTADTENMKQILRWQIEREALINGYAPSAIYEIPQKISELVEGPNFMRVIEDSMVSTYTKGADAEELKSIQNFMKSIDSIDDLDELQMMQVINYLRGQRGLKPMQLMDVFEKYANMPTRALGENFAYKLHSVPLDVDMKMLDDIIDAGGDPKLVEAAVAAKNSIIARKAPVPSLATSSFDQAARELEILDYIEEFMQQTSGTRHVPGIPENVMSQLRTVWVNAHTIAGEVAKRARNQALLDYRDRRTIDGALKMIFPWHYWWSRSIPNWGWTMATNPRLSAHWMRLNREIREYNDNDPNVPEWAKGDIVMKNPMGYPGRLMWDHRAAFNAVGTIFDTFEDEDRQKDVLGQILSMTDKFGPAPHPMLMAAYAGERWFLHGDEAAARSMGHLAPATRVLSAVTGKTAEPWLWITDEEGKRIPWTGSTKWDIEKTNRLMGYRQKMGEVPAEQAMLETAQRRGPAYEDTLMNKVVSGYRTIPVIASSILGLRLQPRQDWEIEMAADQDEYYRVKEQQGPEAAKMLLAEKPWLSTYWMSWDNETTRMKFLADSVLSNRLPPMPGMQRDALLEKAGLPKELVDRFYEDTRKEGGKVGLADWDKDDYETFSKGVVNLAEIMGFPDKQTAREWRKARQQYSTIWDRLERKYPTGENDQDIYFALLEHQGEEAANEFKEHSVLPKYWADKNKAMLNSPLVLKYYGDTMDVDMAVNSLVDDELVSRYGPDIFLKRMQQKNLEDFHDKREFKRLYPEVSESYDVEEELTKQYRTRMKYLRELTHKGQEERIPEEIETFEKLNSRQRAVAEAVDEMRLQADLPIQPPKEWESKYTPDEEELFEVRDQIYAQVVGKYPNYYETSKEYKRVKDIYGKEAAKVYGKESGYFDALSYETLLQAQNPVTLREMEDEKIQYAASAYMKSEAERMWPGIFDQWTEYYSLPKSERKVYWRENPQLGAYKDWSPGAEEWFTRQIMETRSSLRAQQDATQRVEQGATEQRARRVGGLEAPLNLEALANAIGQAESGDNYEAQNPKSTASGRYQYINATWNKYGGFASAREAPPEVQDEKMIKDLQARATKYGNDLERVIAAHYYPAWADKPEMWNKAPREGQPTIREYIQRVMSFLEANQ